MSKLRAAASLFVEEGRALGALDRVRLIVTQLTRESAAAERAGDAALAHKLVELGKGFAEQLGALESGAATARMRAEQLVRDVEHPGAVLARRLLAAFYAARAGWRGSR